MEFCPECGMRLVMTQNMLNDEVHPFQVCPKCNYQKRVTSEKFAFSNVVEHSTPEQIAVIDTEHANLRTMPATKVECPKCGNKEAFWWFVQTRGSDESPTQFFRCTKCLHTRREMT